MRYRLSVRHSPCVVKRDYECDAADEDEACAKFLAHNKQVAQDKHAKTWPQIHKQLDAWVAAGGLDEVEVVPASAVAAEEPAAAVKPRRVHRRKPAPAEAGHDHDDETPPDAVV